MIHIISADESYEVGTISHGNMTVDNENNKAKVAVKILRVATVEEYRTQCEKIGYECSDLLPHGPFYYEAQILD